MKALGWDFFQGTKADDVVGLCAAIGLCISYIIGEMSLRKPRGNIHIFIPIVNAKAGKRYGSFVRILIFSNSRPGRCAYRSNNTYITVHSLHNLTTNLHCNIATGRFLCTVVDRALRNGQRHKSASCSVSGSADVIWVTWPAII
jgi:hypothetical protein